MKKTIALPTSVLLVTISSSLSAQVFTDLFVFGDSGSDVGNVLAFTDGDVPMSPPYFEGRFSNGPVWVEHLATGLGLPAPEASLRGGNNFAYGGAQTGDGGSTIFRSVPNVGSQIMAFMESGKTIDETALVVVWAGHNDLFGGLSPATAATNLGSHISALHGEGARSFLVGNFAGARGDRELNELFAEEVLQLRQALPDSSITVFDFNSLAVEAFFSPANFGLTNVGPACRDCILPDGMFNPNPVDISPNPETHLLWDEVHASAAFHRIMGRRALSTIVDSQPSGDFDGDGAVDSSDIDLLMNAIANGTDTTTFDLNGDDTVDDGDRDAWLVQASIKNGFAAPLLVGDSNLDGAINATDLNTMALNWRQDVNDWTSGNFTGASVNAADLNALALNWRQSVPTAAWATPPVPEPSAWLLTLLGLALVWRRPRKRG